MFIQELCGPSDFLNLTNEDIRYIMKSMESEVPEGVDECDYLYDNMDAYIGNEDIERVISNKIFAGQVSVKWFTFRYIKGLTKEGLIEKLVSADLGYNIAFKNRNVNGLSNDISGIYYDGRVYTVKIIMSNGKKRYSDGVSLQSIELKKPVIVKINVEEQWIEIRTNDNLCSKVLEVLKNRLGICHTVEVNVLKNYGNNIHALKDDLIDGFWNAYKANPTENLALTEQDQIAVLQIINAVDEFFNDNTKDISEKGKILTNTLANVDIDTEGLRLEEIILAGVEHFSIKVRDDSEKDLGTQTLYSLLKKDVLENTGFIRFSNVEGGRKHTMLVGKKTNSIAFRTSVTEDVIEYIRNKIL